MIVTQPLIFFLSHLGPDDVPSVEDKETSGSQSPIEDPSAGKDNQDFDGGNKERGYSS